MSDLPEREQELLAGVLMDSEQERETQIPRPTQQPNAYTRRWTSEIAALTSECKSALDRYDNELLASIAEVHVEKKEEILKVHNVGEPAMQDRRTARLVGKYHDIQNAAWQRALRREKYLTLGDDERKKERESTKVKLAQTKALLAQLEGIKVDAAPLQPPVIVTPNEADEQQTLRHRLDRKQETVWDLREQVEDSKSKAQSLQEDLQHCEEQLKASQDAVEKDKIEAAESQQVIVELQNHIAGFTQQQQGLPVDAAGEAATLRHNIARANAEKATMEAALATTKERLASAEATINKLCNYTPTPPGTPYVRSPLVEKILSAPSTATAKFEEARAAVYRRFEEEKQAAGNRQ
ncbi:hypothetical protein B9Z65_882 [Elsinoe australis]|uniref:Uncharacterized protein n=1 Tax=Elsinoe australis TaxID=40998 RepID=A0A2P8AJS9_9PEZI|nr:hypothetical protein B9Z65_882 [Elsinoe australis]